MSPLQRMFAAYSAGEDKAGPVKSRSQRARTSILMRQPWFVISLSVFVLLGGAAATLYVYFSSPPTTLRFAVGSPASWDARLVHALAQQFVRDHASIRLTPVIEEGAAAAAQALDASQADLAIVRRDIAYPQSGQAIAELRESFVIIIVPAAGSRATGDTKTQPKRNAKAKKTKPVEKIEDLEGRRIGVVGHSAANTEVLEIVLKQYQIAPEKVTVVPLDPRDIGRSLRNNPVDAIFAISPVAGRVIADAIAASTNGKTVPTFLKIGASEAIAARHPVYEATEIKAGVLGGPSPMPEQAVKTIGFKHYIVGRSALPDDTVGEFTRLLFAARQTLAGEYPTLARIEKPDTDRDADVPAHPGAAAFLDNDQKTIFEKYSDYVYFGLMLMSGLGSAIAWLAGCARTEDRVKRLKVLDRLLDIVQEARAAKTVDELAKLRGEADGVLSQTIRQLEASKLDESALMAFSLALDQAQLAISDRRSTLALANSPTGLPLCRFTQRGCANQKNRFRYCENLDQPRPDVTT